jgi:multicomponent K+:H+ antiporter subunit G
MMTMAISPWLAVPAAILLVAGGLFTLIGAAGLLRLPDFFTRMHAPTLGATLGAGCVLLASALVSSGVAGRPVIHELLIGVFLVATAPVTAILLMRAARRRARED